MLDFTRVPQQLLESMFIESRILSNNIELLDLHLITGFGDAEKAAAYNEVRLHVLRLQQVMYKIEKSQEPNPDVEEQQHQPAAAAQVPPPPKAAKSNKVKKK